MAENAVNIQMHNLKTSALGTEARNSPKTILVTWSEHRDLESEIWTKMEIVVQDQKCDTVISVSHLSSKTEYYNLNMVLQNTLNFR